jgi:hypothetical protein
VWAGNKVRRKYTIERLCLATTPEGEVKKLRDEHLRPINQGLQGVGSATNFQAYIEQTYNTTHLPLLAASTQSRYKGVIEKYLRTATESARSGPHEY